MYLLFQRRHLAIPVCLSYLHHQLPSHLFFSFTTICRCCVLRLTLVSGLVQCTTSIVSPSTSPTTSSTTHFTIKRTNNTMAWKLSKISTLLLIKTTRNNKYNAQKLSQSKPVLHLKTIIWELGSVEFSCLVMFARFQNEKWNLQVRLLCWEHCANLSLLTSWISSEPDNP